MSTKPFARSYALVKKIKPGIRYPHAASQSYDPPQICQAYNWPNGVSVSPLTIVIGELGGRFYPSDIPLWTSRSGLPAPVVKTHLLPGADDSPGDADGEVALDWQLAAQCWSYMTGLPANILIVYGANAEGQMPAVMHYANTLPDVGAGSWSWGGPEDQQSSDLTSMDTQARAAKFPWTAASGDNDSNDGTNSPDVDCPACIASIIGCGGTSRVPNGGAETVWNNGNGEGTGGGFSKIVPRPTWQPKNSQSPSGFDGRLVPDWAAVADPNTGYNCIINGSWQVIGGTSAVAPLMAGFLAVVNGVRVKNNLPMLNGPSLLPLLWGMQSSFLDLSSGNNGAYKALNGPDPCSGLGRALPILFAGLTGSFTPTPTPTPIPTPIPTPVPVPTPTPSNLLQQVLAADDAIFNQLLVDFRRVYGAKADLMGADAALKRMHSKIFGG